MKNSLKNTGLFLFVYVPLTALIGVIGGFFSSPDADSIEYDLFLWFVIAVQLLLPSLIAFIVALAVTKIWQLLVGSGGVRWFLTFAITLLLPLTQASLWGGKQIGIEWLVVAVLPAFILALLTRFSTSKGSPG